MIIYYLNVIDYMILFLLEDFLNSAVNWNGNRSDINGCI